VRGLIESWFNMLPEDEKDLPIVEVDGVILTPRQVYEEVIKGTELGERAQKVIERLRSPMTLSYEDTEMLRRVALERAKKKLASLPPGVKIGTLSGDVLTPEEFLQRARDYIIDYEVRKILSLVRW